ncbi:alkaline phosphatase [Drosophila rhopaloa]|uniref:alkaline phosphatase n=1 Tax=Drosophila rhopaloa TaxID=1041015 RepID=A0A6P4EXS4_DRORH|nr:alkaline phosphatase [Drosophila rhopaloa]
MGKSCLILCFIALLFIQVRSELTDDQENAQHPRLQSSRDFEALDEELETRFWHDKAQSILADKLASHNKLNENRAKNVILFLGDGMSIHTIAATRAFMGDSNKQVFFEKFPYLGLSKTYAVNERTPDSANTATAYLTGVKANYGTLGVNAQVQRGDCVTNSSTHVQSIGQWAQEAGKWAGIVSTARVTHASPAGVYAHVAEREWEHDGEIVNSNCSPDVNTDVARQLVEWPVGQELRVIMGGGRSYFLDQSMHDETGVSGLRTDGRNLIHDWQKIKKEQGSEGKYVWSLKGLKETDLSKTDYLLGLFDTSHMPYHGDRRRTHYEDAEPSLSDMTEAAINLLSKNEQGYFLFVESGRIDMAHHATKARKALEDTQEFAAAVEMARKMTNEEDTLIVVTSDHSHTMSINGYPYRRQNILSLAPNMADDELPFTILSYANGPGFEETYSSESGRIDLSHMDTTNAEFAFQATVPLSSETHGAEDVGVFASGPYEHLFTGNFEQSSIPAMMAYAANIGPFAKDKLNE